MKSLKALVVVGSLLSQAAFADTFVETIARLSARDAVTVAGDQLYASNYNTGAVYQIALDGSFETLLANNARGPAGIRLDDAGNIYVALYNQSAILRIAPDGTETTFASNVREPIALDWDSMSNLYVSNFAGDTTVTRIAPDGTATAFASISELNNVSSLCVDDSDDVYVTSYFSSDIYRVTPAGQVSLFATSDAPGYAYLQFDSANQQFYATVTNTNALMTFDMTGTPQTLINSPQGGTVDGPLIDAAVDSAIGLAVSADGKHVYFATNTHIRRMNIADPSVDQVRPYFTSENNISVEEGTEVNHTFEFTDPNGDPLLLALENLPDWLTFDGVDSLTGTPGSDQAGETVSLTADLSDGFATVSQAFSVSVTAAAAPAPVPTPAPAPAPAPAPTSDSGGGGSTGYGLLLLIMGIALLRRCLPTS